MYDTTWLENRMPLWNPTIVPRAISMPGPTLFLTGGVNTLKLLAAPFCRIPGKRTRGRTYIPANVQERMVHDRRG